MASFEIAAVFTRSYGEGKSTVISKLTIFFESIKSFIYSFNFIFHLQIHFNFRCSSAFFAEERAELARKRQKIRMLQQRKQLMDYSTFKDLPEQIPLLLTIGARVTARWVCLNLRKKYRVTLSSATATDVWFALNACAWGAMV